MTLTKVVLDTNIYVDWMNRGSFEAWMMGRGLVRYLSAVVGMARHPFFSDVGPMTESARSRCSPSLKGPPS